MTKNVRRTDVARAAIAASLLVTLLAPAATHAEDASQAEEIRALRQRVEQLEKALLELQRDRERPATDATTSSDAAAGGAADEGAGEASAASQKKSATHKTAAAEDKPNVTAGYKDGFFLGTGDGGYKLQIGGYGQVDSRWALDHHGRDINDGFFIRRARIDVRGTLAEHWDFRIRPDFAGSSLTLLETYVDTKFSPAAVLRIGKTTTPFGLERLQSGSHLPIMERSLADNLVPNRDIGAHFFGDVADEVFSYQAGVFNGAPDGGSAEANFNDGVDVVARVFAHPWKATPVEALHGFGLGLAGTYGEHQGTTSSPQLPQFRTSSRSAFFRYRSDDATFADGTHWRVSPQAYYYFGPFGAMGEYVHSSQELRRGAVHGTTANDAWQARVSYVLTGEDASYKAVVPAQPFDFGRGGWGAWEIAARISSLDVDDDAFRLGFADPEAAATQADAYTLALNWYLNKNVAFYLDYEHSEFKGGRGAIAPRVAPANRRDEDVFLTRMQFVF
ncbi:MAG TPA: porin [Candidatus Limnocylindrales bacterium]|nr:porin [Candidatus Limnocylindrales bacterium]